MGVLVNFMRHLLVVGLVASGQAFALKPLPPLNRDMLTGAWVGPNIGPSASDTYWRVVFEDSGKGSVTALWGEPEDGELSVYRIEKIELDGPSVVIYSVPLSQEGAIEVEGTTRLGGIDLKIVGGAENSKWVQTVHLEEETSLGKRIKAVGAGALKVGSRR